jgi:hypothetical protein
MTPFVFSAAVAFSLHNTAADITVFGAPDEMLAQEARSCVYCRKRIEFRRQQPLRRGMVRSA